MFPLVIANDERVESVCPVIAQPSNRDDLFGLLEQVANGRRTEFARGPARSGRFWLGPKKARRRFLEQSFRFLRWRDSTHHNEPLATNAVNCRHASQFTAKVRVMLWVNVVEPEVAVAVTVRVYVPTGVPGCEELVPPPQEVRSPAARIVTQRKAVAGLSLKRSSPRRRRREASAAPASRAARHAHHTGVHGGAFG